MTPNAASLPSASDVAQFATSELGSASYIALGRPENLALVRHRVRLGDTLEDAVLGVAHDLARTNTEIGSEFLTHFLGDLAARSSGLLPSRLGGVADSADLVQSVVGDLLEGSGAPEFRGRREYLAYLAKKVRWKASEYARSKALGGALSHLLVDMELPGSGLVNSGPSALTLLIEKERDDLLRTAFLRLSPRDQQLLELRLDRAPLSQAAQSLGCSVEATKKATQRALARLELLARDAGEALN